MHTATTEIGCSTDMQYGKLKKTLPCLVKNSRKITDQTRNAIELKRLKTTSSQHRVHPHIDINVYAPTYTN